MRSIRPLVLILIAATHLITNPVSAQDAAAQSAAEDILRSLSAGQFTDVWNRKVSKFFKDRTTEEAFLSSMSIGRPQLGKLQSLKLVSSQHVNQDSATGYQGDIYFITFRSTYPTGEFYESIALVKDSDGQYRLSGIQGAPVPK